MSCRCSPRSRRCSGHTRPSGSPSSARPARSAPCNDTVGSDFARAEQLSVPLTFVILLLAFGAFVAAGLPVLLALSAVLGSVGISALVSHVSHAADTTSSMILLMGMAVGVDYSLFYVKREREERAAGHSGRDALHRAAATSGRAVLISGITVLIAMAGMLLAGSRIYTSLALGAMIVVFMSMVGSLTVLPALLGKLGDRIDRGVLAVLAAGAHARAPLGAARASAPEGSAHAAAALQGRPRRSRASGRAVLRPSLRHPGRRRSRVGGAARRARAARVRHAPDDDRVRRHALAPADRADVRRRSSARSPARRARRSWSSARPTSTSPQARAALADLRATCARHRRHARADPRRSSTAITRSRRSRSRSSGRARTRASVAALKTLRGDVRPGGARRAAWRPLRRHGRDGGRRRLHRVGSLARADRVRVRARARVPAAPA